MTALNTERMTPQYEGSSGPAPGRFSDPVKGSTKVFLGSLVALIAGFAAPASAAAGQVCRGRALATVDNSAGADGDLSVETETGVFCFENSAGGDAVAATEIGKVAYAVDDQTVAKTSNGGARSVAGLVIQVDTRGVWVLVGMLPTGSVQALMVRQALFGKPAADGAAGTATAETSIFRATEACRILAVYFVPSAALTGDVTNNATLTVKTRDGAGGAASSVAALTTTASWTAFVPASLGAISNGALAAGAILTLTIAKGGTGVVVPSGTLVVLYEPA